MHQAITLTHMALSWNSNKRGQSRTQSRAAIVEARAIQWLVAGTSGGYLRSLLKQAG